MQKKYPSLLFPKKKQGGEGYSCEVQFTYLPNGRFQKKNGRFQKKRGAIKRVSHLSLNHLFPVSTPEAATTMADIRDMLTASEPKDTILFLSFSFVRDVPFFLGVNGSELKFFWGGRFDVSAIFCICSPGPLVLHSLRLRYIR